MITERQIREGLEKSLAGAIHFQEGFDINYDFPVLNNVISDDGYGLVFSEAHQGDKYIEISLQKSEKDLKGYKLSFRPGYFSLRCGERKNLINQRIMDNPFSMLHGSKLRLIPPKF